VKISVIIPVYNGEETIAQCLEALLGQDYPAEDYEVLVVDDGSSDNTRQIAKRYPVRLIELEQNSGRIIAREQGAQAACYEQLLFVDVRVIVAKDILKQLVSIDYQPLMAGEQGELKHRHGFDTLFYLIRRRIYSPYFPQINWGKELWIDKDNFDKVPKGTTCFYCSRRLFLESIPSRKDKVVNDDIFLLRSIVPHKKILRHTDIRITYLQRDNWRSVLRHVYERGPRFADYYLNGPSKYYRLWLLGLILFSGWLGLSLYNRSFWGYGLLAALSGVFGVALFLAENLKDVAIVLIYLPLVALAFVAGIIKGKIIYYTNKAA
jgi:glycosyltransferase involved in cell wall biosynthesis